MSIGTERRTETAGHLVLFYEDDEHLAHAAGGHLLAGLRQGTVAVAVATAAHLAAIEARIARGGVDVDAARAGGRLITLDARAVLDRFLVDGWPDAERFDAVVADLVRWAVARGPGVHVYGEMVALLWGAGNIPATIELEALWNRLGASAPFTLLCAYPSSAVTDHDHPIAVDQVCRLHAEVVGPHPLRAAHTFDADPAALPAVRRFVADVLARWAPATGFGPADVDDLKLAVGELATNAVRHGAPPLQVRLALHPERLRIEVEDHGGGRPAMREVQPTGPDPGGWGLRFVDHIADAWGTHATGARTVVWLDRRRPTS
ncbi:MAG TPA: MEDS domain-containing protein [Acidimicrobiales bacterium]